MLARRAAQRPQRVLQAFGQRDVALATQDDVGVLEAGAHQPEVVQPVIQRHAQHGDAQVAHLGEVGQAHAPGFVGLAEHHLLFLAMQRAPGPNAAFERPTNARIELRVTPPQLVEYGDRPDAWRRQEQRDDLGLEDVEERIGPPSLARSLFVGRQPRVALDPVSGGDADRFLRRRHRQRLGKSELHEQPHLMIVDVTSRHGQASQKRETPSYLTYRDHRRGAPSSNPSPAREGACRAMPASLPPMPNFSS